MTQEFPYVLLADDDPDDREFFVSGMRRLYPHVGVIVFDDGDHLLEYLKDCPSQSFPVYILLDYKMPRLNAPQFLQQTGSGTRYDWIPKIVWSTSPLKRDMEECLNQGAISFVIKPVSEPLLDNMLRSLEIWINTGCVHQTQ
ncbi:MAG TPA: response regulator [Puia sp.]|uniref:response regulator n=1 Tax=Puia sp. TaxID=2045100 RepID=UPI002C0B1DAB|nr:response regulator [Puia sp.]HVU99534.1 response regulator [Puia sp.]